MPELISDTTCQCVCTFVSGKLQHETTGPVHALTAERIWHGAAY